MVKWDTQEVAITDFFISICMCFENALGWLFPLPVVMVADIVKRAEL
jgi:hypothetical protein